MTGLLTNDVQIKLNAISGEMINGPARDRFINMWDVHVSAKSAGYKYTC